MAVQKGKHGGKGFRYPAEIRAQAIELYHGCRGDFSSNEKAARHIAHLLGVGSSRFGVELDITHSE